MAKRVIEAKKRSEPRRDEVSFIEHTLGVLKGEMEQISEHLQSTRLDDVIRAEGLEGVRLRKQLVDNLNEYQASYADVAGLVDFYKQAKEAREKRAMKGFEQTGGAQEIFKMLDAAGIEAAGVGDGESESGNRELSTEIDDNRQ
jgi:hypothetical protein